ncbi:hypothetical protein SY2F82_03840 [Streptomyces sp. Y2F8-2]|nr:hypothetical protein SY2F82_03840 [Streptomyces sp. Y2F8-2]
MFSGSAAMTPRWPMVKKDTRLPSSGVVVRGSRTSVEPRTGRRATARRSAKPNGPVRPRARPAGTAPERAPRHTIRDRTACLAGHGRRGLAAPPHEANPLVGAYSAPNLA